MKTYGLLRVTWHRCGPNIHALKYLSRGFHLPIRSFYLVWGESLVSGCLDAVSVGLKFKVLCHVILILIYHCQNDCDPIANRPVWDCLAWTDLRMLGVANWTRAIYWVCDICTFRQCHRWCNPTWPQCAIYSVFLQFSYKFPQIKGPQINIRCP